VQIVTTRWYHILNSIQLGLNILLIAGYLLVKVGPFASYGARLDLTTFALAVAYVIYICIFYAFLTHKISYWMASLFGSMIFAVNEINLILNTRGHYELLFITLWLCVLVLAGSFGSIIILAADFLTTVTVLIGVNFQVSHINPPSLLLLIGSYVISTVTFFLVWKPIYKPDIGSGGGDINQLSGMLKNKEEQTEILMRSISDGVIVINTDGKITLMNEAAAKLTDWPIQEAVGIDVFLVVKLSKTNGSIIPKEANPFTLALQKQVNVQETNLITSKANKGRIVSVVISPIVVSHASSATASTMVGLVAVIRDVSAQLAAEQQRADFISTASHEMRTPVAAIEGYLSLVLNEKVSSIDARAREYVDKAYSSTRQLGKLFQDLLTSSKAEDGRLSSHPVVVEMGEFITRLVEELQLAAQKKSIIVDFESSEHDAPWASTKVVRPLMYVHVDPDRLREVLTNLFDNAVKFTDSGKITIGLSADSERVKFFVRDTGVGIPADDIPHLFQKFYRVDNSAVRTIGGTGLGLYISRKIVELYSGKIWVESQMGKGSTFYIELPRISDQQAKAQKESDTLNDQLAMPQSNSSI
jgi:signal transduction histidine kinase